jgi:threonine dehydrogenase-like Zn-dependent dehydrogenase
VLGVVSRNGAYAEEVVVEDYMLRAIPAGMDYESAAMVEPVAVAVRALRQGGLCERDRVLVLGAGNIGLLLIQVARALGAGYVAVTDIVPERLALAERLGVDEAIEVRGGFPAARLEKQFDVIIDGVANEASVRDALSSARRGARIVVYGVPHGDITFPLKVAFSKDVALMTSRLYGADFDPAIRLISEGGVRVRDLITHRVHLGEAPEQILSVLEGRQSPIKVMIST